MECDSRFGSKDPISERRQDAPFALIGFVDVLLISSIAVFWFQIPIRGSLLLLPGGHGALPDEHPGRGSADLDGERDPAAGPDEHLFLLLSGRVASGFLFPIPNMPAAVQWLTYLMPMRYFLGIIRGILLKGIDLGILWPQALALAGFGVGIFLASLAMFRARSS